MPPSETIPITVSAELRSLIDFASGAAGQIFHKTGRVKPMWHAIKRDGEAMILPAMSDDKDLATIVVRAAFQLFDVVRYVFIDEAWMVDARGRPNAAIAEAELDRMNREGLSEHPDRREVLLFTGEDHASGMVMARRFILRPEHGKATLSALEWFDLPAGGMMQGRMVGLLPTEGKPS